MRREQTILEQAELVLREMKPTTTKHNDGRFTEQYRRRMEAVGQLNLPEMSEPQELERAA